MNKENINIELKINIEKLYTEGLSDKKISKILNIHPAKVSKYRKLLGLKSLFNSKLEIIDNEHGKCNKCNEIKLIEEFQIQRRNHQYEGRMAYCRTCRKKQLNNALNKNIEKYIRSHYIILKRKRISNGIIFTISFEEFLEEYKKSNNKCFYTDIEFSLLKHGFNIRNKRDKISVDRIIPELGYIKENIVFANSHINTMKNDCTLQEIKEWMPNFYERIYNKIKDVEIFKNYIPS